MTRQELFEQIKKKRSFLCVGLDSDYAKLPECVKNDYEDPLFIFNKRIIDATADKCVAYKPNLAFYESMGSYGLHSFERTVGYLKEHYPDHFIIADAKRGDIGNTGEQYAFSFFQHLDVDALTVSPYMGQDSVMPSLKYEGKWTVLLALTSNPGSEDFQMMKDESGEYLFERVIRRSKAWGSPENLMYVVGATKAQMLERIRMMIPDHFLLVPGVGKQGGSLEEVAQYGLNDHCGLIVNSSRNIIFADNSDSFDRFAAEEAEKVRQQMSEILYKAKLI